MVRQDFLNTLPREIDVPFFRVYSNGDWAAESAEGQEYSKTMRPGCALFNGRECVQCGYLNQEEVAAVINRIKP